MNSTNNSPKYGFSVRCVKGLVLALPSLSTSDITNITTTSATCGGIILSDGDAMVTARGICWNTSSNPTIDNSFTTNGTGTGTFTSSINGLSPNTTYYVRTYATNSMGTSYGNEVSFTTAARTTAPILSTSTISNITSTSATSGGDITNDGGAPVTARGICWSLTANPTIANSFTVDSIGTATYISSMTGLTPNTTYYVRAYATNSVGTSYGNEVIFTTLSALPTLTTSAALAITSSTSTIEGNITSDGGAAITARGICWSTNSNPTIADSYTNDGTGTGTFSSSMTGLTPNTTYYVRAYATNSVGTSYGNEVSFTTFAALSTLTTSEASAITSSTSMIEGNITSDGGAAITARGICWSTSSKPTIADSYTNDGTGIGTFSSSMTGLTPNTTYYIRAYATNSVGTSYGNEVSLKTIQSGITYNVTVPIGTNEVYISGNFSISPWTTKNFKLSKVDVTHFTITIPDSLTTLNTEYKYCSGPDWYYEELNGIGSPINNRVYSSSDVVLEWRNVYNPSSAIEKDVTILATVPINTSECYITGGFDDWRGPITSNKMIKVSTTADGTIFTKTIHTIDSISLEYRFVAGPSWDYDQTQSENYKYRIDGAAVKVKSFKAYYNAISFTLPTLTTTIPSAITTTTATVGGEITNDGGTTVTARGVCWSTSSNPTIADSYTTDGTGTGVFTSLLTGLTPNVTYYVRAYATNIAGTAYGNEVTVACNTGNSSISGKIFNDINNNGLFDAGVDSVQSTGWAVKIQGSVNRTIVPSFDGTYSFNDLPLGIYTVSEIVPELWTVIAPFWGGEYTIDLTAGGNVVNKDFANIYLLRSNSDIEYLSFPNGQKTGDNSANPSSSLVPLSSVNISQVPVNSIHLYVNSAGYSPDTFYVTKNQIVQFAITNLDNSASHPTYFNDSRLLGVIVGLPPGETRMTTFKINNIQYGEKIHFLDGVPGHNQSGLMIVRDGTVHLPTTTTINPTKLTATTATSSGNITNDGGDYINSRGVCWSTTVNPTIADNKTSDGTGSGVFTSTITGLSPNTTYYVRAYATNVAGTSYGNEISFTTIIPIATPILTTNIALCTSSSTATCGGSISNDGGGAVSARGVCWSTSSNPTISLNHSSDSTGTGNFTSSLTGLTPNVTYYVRAYATNIAGTAYGNEVTVACNTGNSSISGKIFNDINNNGLFDAGVDSVQSTGWAVKIQGSVNRTIVPSFDGTYSFNDLPLGIYTVSEIVPEDWTVLSPYWSGKYTVDLSVGGNMVNKDFANFYLQRNNSDVESLFFPNRLNTGDNAVVPADPSSPKESAPISVANIPVNSIHLTVSTAGFKPDTLYIKKDYIVQFALTSTDDFTHIFYLDNPKFQGTILGVAGGETRMKCFKTYNVLPGEIYRFTCGIPGHSGRGEIGYMKIIGDPIIVVTPTVTTIPPSTITQTTIISGGNISSDGGTTVTARGICWNMMPNPTIANSKTADGFGTGSFTSSLTGLTAGTTYYIRAYATNSGGTSYGNEISFSTVSLSPKPGLIAYYPFNGNSIDESGNGHDGTVNGATLTTDRFGNVNKAYSFNGSNNWINLGTWFNYNKFSISLWVNKTGFSGDYECIIDNNHYWNPPSSHQNWLLQGNPSSLEYGFGVPDFPAPGINFNLKLNKWQHIICIKDSSTIKLYLDGILQNSVACNYAINYVDQNLCIGRHGGQFLRCFMGELDDIRFYNYPISDSEISQLYNESNNTTPVLPTLTTTTASAITSATSTSGGNIISDGGTTVSARGVCWSTAPTPTTANSYTTDGTGVGIFTSSMTGLTANTTYYVRAYATNSVGTAYGNEISFMTLLPATGTVTDIEGNVYDYLTIGSQTWMVENLKTTTYNDGTSIPNVTVASIWATLATPAYSWYNNDVANKNTYGGLYNWYAINTGKLAPTGWHVSTDAEWTTLTTYLGGESVAGGKLTEIGTAHWLIPNTGATNETGFTALPGGTHYSIDGTYLYLGNIGYWWTASESDAESAWNRGWSVSNNSFGVGRGVNYKRAGFSVRCIRDY